MGKPHSVRRRALLRDRASSVSLEFAAVALTFCMLVLAVLEVGFDLYVQVALDATIQAGARNVQIGAVQGTAGETSAQFATAAMCPSLGGLLDCSLLTAGVETIATGYNYYTNPNTMTQSSAPVCTGTGGQMMLIEAWYAGPTFVGLLIPAFSTTVNGSRVHLTFSSAGFVNEYFTGGQSTGTGC